MVFSPLRLTSMADTASASQNAFCLEYVEQPGIFGIERPITSAAALGFVPDGRLRLFEDDDLNFDPLECTDVVKDKTGGAYKGELEGTVPTAAKRLVFKNSGNGQNTITLTKAGVYAACYCQFEEQCDAATGWAFVARFTIRGPLKTLQTWQYSTNVVFRLEYSGWGLSDSNKIRITADNDDCEGEPTKASFAYTFLKVECPNECNSVGEISSSVN